MIANKYSNFLTIILVIVILVIVVLLAFLGYNTLKGKKVEKDSAKAIAEFEQNINQDSKENTTDKNNQKKENNPIIENNPNEETGNSTETKVIKKTYYKEFVMVGYITIPKTNVKQPVLDSVSPKALETAVAVVYPSNAQLNQPGNVVIIGHNYRNGQFFSNNKKLSTGDKITIKDESGTELTYTIYEIFETTPEDTEFYNRDTNGAIEVTLSTCTDDSKARTVILARVE